MIIQSKKKVGHGHRRLSRKARKKRNGMRAASFASKIAKGRLAQRGTDFAPTNPPMPGFCTPERVGRSRAITLPITRSKEFSAAESLQALKRSPIFLPPDGPQRQCKKLEVTKTVSVRNVTLNPMIQYSDGGTDIMSVDNQSREEVNEMVTGVSRHSQGMSMSDSVIVNTSTHKPKHPGENLSNTTPFDLTPPRSTNLFPSPEFESRPIKRKRIDPDEMTDTSLDSTRADTSSPMDWSAFDLLDYRPLPAVPPGEIEPFSYNDHQVLRSVLREMSEIWRMDTKAFPELVPNTNVIADCPISYAKQWVGSKFYNLSQTAGSPGAMSALDAHQLYVLFNQECIVERNQRYPPGHSNRKNESGRPITEMVRYNSLNHCWSHDIAYCLSRSIDFLRFFYSINLLKNEVTMKTNGFYKFSFYNAIQLTQMISKVTGYLEHEQLRFLRDNQPDFVLRLDEFLLPDTAIRRPFELPYVDPIELAAMEKRISFDLERSMEAIYKLPISTTTMVAHFNQVTCATTSFRTPRHQMLWTA
jgi:hypothetical protein